VASLVPKSIVTLSSVVVVKSVPAITDFVVTLSPSLLVTVTAASAAANIAFKSIILDSASRVTAVRLIGAFAD
jgi:hypothetical protein